MRKRMHKNFYIFLIAFFCCHFYQLNGQELYLKDKLRKATPGDYIVTLQNKTYTFLLIDTFASHAISLEEITVPSQSIQVEGFSWKKWVEQNAPGHTSWVRYVIDTASGHLGEYFSYTKNGWYTIPEGENFLSTLLNLKFYNIPIKERRKVGPPPPSQASDRRPYWQPKLIFEGKVIPGISFEAWRTFWPKDGSELSGKIIEIYLPQTAGLYPSYFPYWLQVSGIVGKAKIHMIDSGKGARGRGAPAKERPLRKAG
ncbi:hypothetical protein DB42_AQ00580 [Neochlamydia sp. EPS4]|nr:hypothetical protein DB42_AQ00580 [Neochlamydia sp. EPS4]